MDLLLQTSTQSHSHRIVKYYHQRQELHVFPPGPFADSAEELGPLSSHARGPCLVLFSNMHLSPGQFNNWFKGSVIERPCVRTYWLQRDIPAQPDKQALLQAIVAGPVPQGLSSVRLDVYPKKIETQLGDELEAAGYSHPMQPSACSHVLFVVQMPDTGLWRWSYLDKAQLWRHAHDQPARFNKSVATAINKIAEAMHVLQLVQQPQATQGSCSNNCSQREHISNGHPAPHLQPQQQPQQQPEEPSLPDTGISSSSSSSSASQAAAAATPTVRWAIDVGACPGGWTSYLADACAYYVIAIDPADLHPDVTARRGVHHIKAKSGDALEQVELLLQGQQADLLVCDANDHVTNLAHFLLPVLPKLKSGGWLVLTLKFYGRGNKTDDFGRELMSAVPGLEPGRCLWLMANTLCERTYVARKR